MALYLFFKFTITAAIVVIISEVAKRSTLMGAIVASLPLTSILAMIWLHHETKDLDRITNLSWGIFWMVVPSLAFFLLINILIRSGLNFYLSLLTAGAGTALIYYLFHRTLSYFGIYY